MNRNTGIRLAALAWLSMLFASACTRFYSQAPLATPTLIPTSLFVSPFPTGQDPMQIVAQLGTQTALAAQTASAATGTPVTPTLSTPETEIPPGVEISPTPTLATPLTAAAVTTPPPITVVPGSSSPTPPPATVVIPTVPVARPATYTLQSGEWPYCIARRFNVNPQDLLSLNSISDGNLFQVGLVLRIPPSGSWPGERSLHAHPATFIVGSTADFSSYNTIYGIACYYGDVFPEAIARANNLPLSATLKIGQSLSIP